MAPKGRAMYSLLLMCVTSGAVASSSNGLPDLPGLDLIGMGFDAVTGILPNAAQRIVQYTYNDATQFTNPMNNSLQYKVPDQVTVISDTGIQKSVVSKVVYSSQEFSDVMKAGIDWGSPLAKALMHSPGTLICKQCTLLCLSAASMLPSRKPASLPTSTTHPCQPLPA